MEKPVLIWFKSDLRLHDNEVVAQAVASGRPVLALYVLDERQLKNHSLGFPRMGAFRMSFLKEALEDLQMSLSKKGVQLIIQKGNPEECVERIARENEVTTVFTSDEAASDERLLLRQVKKRLDNHGISLRLYWTHTLIHPDDLPMKISELPVMFTAFRKKVEQHWKVRPEQNEPQHFITTSTFSNSLSVDELNLVLSCADSRSAFRCRGGETAALLRLQDYVWKNDRLRVYKETRDQLLGENYSSKFSASLALGCISPRRIHQEVKRYEQERIANESTYWLIIELLWRDYFFFVTLQNGAKIFRKEGIQNKLIKTNDNREVFELWRTGKTGQSFIDANMKELLLTGFMSNRGRQNVASYFVHDLKLDWRWGAAWFESQLVDYDPCSNWLNWAYVAGVGNDPRPNRYFNPETQASRYDPDGSYVKFWID